MKLESKLGISTGVLILAMLVSASVAHLRVQEANRLANTVADGRIPIICRARDVRAAMMTSVQSLETYILLGADRASSEHLRQVRSDNLNAADKPLAQLLELGRHYDLGADAPRIQQIQPGLVQLHSVEDEVERLNELHTPQASRQARDLLNSQILSRDAPLFESMRLLVQSQETQCDADMDRLQEANRAVLLTLWTATLLGAIVGGVISFILARRLPAQSVSSPTAPTPSPPATSPAQNSTSIPPTRSARSPAPCSRCKTVWEASSALSPTPRVHSPQAPDP